jgi:hypothetical protein
MYGFVAAETIDHALKGRAIYIPGTVNRLIKLLGGMVPPTIIARLVGSRWRTTREKLIPV